MPIVVTKWSHGDLNWQETTFAEPLRGSGYSNGDERTLAWAGIELRNLSSKSQPVTLLAFYVGEAGQLDPKLTFQSGVISRENGEPFFSVAAPNGWTVEFVPVCAAESGGASGAPSFCSEAEKLAFLRSLKGVFNSLVLRGSIKGESSVRLTFNRLFNPGSTAFWEVTPAAPPVSTRELTGRSFDRGLRRMRASWEKQSRPVARFETPEADLNNIYRKAMLDGYILTKRWNGDLIVFDSVATGYRCQWDDSSTKWFYALDVMGDHGTAGRLLHTVFKRQGSRHPNGTRTSQGCFSDVTNIKGEGDAAARTDPNWEFGSTASWTCCNGWALWAMAEHARLTGDRAWLAAHKAQILEGCHWITRERRYSFEQTNNPCAGLIYGKFVCDLPDLGGSAKGVGYFTYTDAISYMGMHEMAQLLTDWGYPEGPGLLEECEAYRRDIVAAVDQLTGKSEDPWYVPWVLSAPQDRDRYFYDVVGPINLAFACGNGGVLPPTDKRIDNVIRWIIDHNHQGKVENVVGVPSPFVSDGSAFYTQDLAMTLLEMGRVEEFLRILYTLTSASISHETLTTTEWGPNVQPHVHSISSFIRMFRAMFIQERGGGLYLLQGIPRRWLEQGKRIQINEAPSWYGPMSLDCQSSVDSGSIDLRLQFAEQVNVPIHLKLRLPQGLQIKSCMINGRAETSRDGEWITIAKPERKMRLKIQVEKL
ncbi:MAG TPA: hypothetical protein VGY56_08785 [Verrucomicrobiae bacterium]|nr:hypothetical protein [Verrucomicrobiae bacterium]